MKWSESFHCDNRPLLRCSPQSSSQRHAKAAAVTSACASICSAIPRRKCIRPHSHLVLIAVAQSRHGAAMQKTSTLVKLT